MLYATTAAVLCMLWYVSTQACCHACGCCGCCGCCSCRACLVHTPLRPPQGQARAINDGSLKHCIWDISCANNTLHCLAPTPSPCSPPQRTEAPPPATFIADSTHTFAPHAPHTSTTVADTSAVSPTVVQSTAEFETSPMGVTAEAAATAKGSHTTSFLPLGQVAGGKYLRMVRVPGLGL